MLLSCEACRGRGRMVTTAVESVWIDCPACEGFGWLTPDDLKEEKEADRKKVRSRQGAIRKRKVEWSRDHSSKKKKKKKMISASEKKEIEALADRNFASMVHL